MPENPNDMKPVDHSTPASPTQGTEKSGSHSGRKGVSAIGSTAIGAVAGGFVAGPVGAVVGGVLGAMAGGLFSQSVAERVNPTAEDEHWRSHYRSRPYVNAERAYEYYQPAYRTGYEGFRRYGGRGKTYTDVEAELKSDYERNQASTGVAWDEVKEASRDAWERLEHLLLTNRRDRHVARTPQDEKTIELYEEKLVADKHREKAAEVVLGKHIESETANVSMPLQKERVVIERVDSENAEVPLPPESAQFEEGEIAHIDVYEEIPDIRKEAFVTEEVNVHKVVDRTLVEAEEETHREHLDINTSGNPIVEK